MALIKCHECGKEVSTAAASCPGCGAPVAIKKPNAVRGMVKTATYTLLIGVVFFVAMANQKNEARNNSPSQAYPLAEPQKTCKTDYTLCADNKGVMEEYGGSRKARRKCEKKLSDLAPFGEPEYSGSGRFGYYHVSDDAPKTGEMSFIEKNVRLSNGFGAKQKTSVECVYSFEHDAVYKIIVDGGLVDINTEIADAKDHETKKAQDSHQVSLPEQQKTTSDNKIDAEAKVVIAKAEALNDKCRDSPNNPESCAERDKLFEELRERGYCFGHEPQAMFEREWEKCR